MKERIDVHRISMMNNRFGAGARFFIDFLGNAERIDEMGERQTVELPCMNARGSQMDDTGFTPPLLPR